jgi:heme exporter protein D
MFSAFAGSVFAGTEGDNTYYGSDAGNGNPDYYNTFIGNAAGHNSNASANTFIGFNAGNMSTTGDSNTFVGSNAGLYNYNGSRNTLIGNVAGYENPWGNDNTFIGNTAGGLNSGNFNTFLGSYAGNLSYTGNYNVFLGYMAGIYETGSNKLYISNSDTATPLIYGEFDNQIVGINGKLGVGTQAPVRGVHLAGSNAVFRMDRTADTAAFQIVRTDGSGNPMKVFVVGVNASGSNNGEFIINDNGTQLSGALNRRMTIGNTGAVTFTGTVTAQAYYSSSSLTLKDNVRTYENALDTVNRLRGVSFDWKDSGKPSVGLIAEEVAKVVPEVVAYNDGAATGVNYASLVGVLVEAVKEQQKIVKEQQAEMKEQLRINEEQQKINIALSEKVSELERLLTSK